MICVLVCLLTSVQCCSSLTYAPYSIFNLACLLQEHYRLLVYTQNRARCMSPALPQGFPSILEDMDLYTAKHFIVTLAFKGLVKML